MIMTVETAKPVPPTKRRRPEIIRPLKVLPRAPKTHRETV